MSCVVVALAAFSSASMARELHHRPTRVLRIDRRASPATSIGGVVKWSPTPINAIAATSAAAPAHACSPLADQAPRRAGEARESRRRACGPHTRGGWLAKAPS